MQLVNHYAEKNSSHYDVKVIECMNMKIIIICGPIHESSNKDDEGALNVLMRSNKYLRRLCSHAACSSVGFSALRRFFCRQSAT